MKLQTQIPLTKASNRIDYKSQIVLLGSCFSENIGEKLGYFKFQYAQNPFGILFHPLAIENLVHKAIQNYTYIETDIFFSNERWHCFDAHSDLSDVTKEGLLQKLNDGLRLTDMKLKKATHIAITLGTAWVYVKKETGQTVANCHKIPQAIFEKRILSVEELTVSLKNLVEQIQAINKKAQLVFTVSPVRHLKDGFVENQRSKAHLISAVHHLMSFRTAGRNLNYFPSYELMMDELRDYRFYKNDMVHPNELAIDYIWEKFKKVWISEEAYETMDKIDGIQKGLRHRPFHEKSERHQIFLKSLEEKIAYIKKEYPFMSFG